MIFICHRSFIVNFLCTFGLYHLCSNIFIIFFQLVLDFSSNKMQNLCVSPQKVRMAKYILGRLLATLMETIHIELPNKTVDVAMPKVLGKDILLKFLDVLNGKLFSIGHPLDNLVVFFILG